MFCPQHRDGECPKGRFVGEKMVTFDKWHRTSDLGRDVAFIKVNSGLVSAVGFVTVATDLPRSQKCVALGYPGNVYIVKLK